MSKHLRCAATKEERYCKFRRGGKGLAAGWGRNAALEI